MPMARHGRPRSGKTSPEDAFRSQCVSRQSQEAELVAQRIDTQPGIDERAEDHVAAGARETIEVGEERHWRQLPTGSLRQRVRLGS